MDSLNRKMHGMHIDINTSTSNWNDSRIKEGNNTNEFFQQVKVGLQQQGTTNMFEHYKIKNGIFNYKNRVYIPNSKNLI